MIYLYIHLCFSLISSIIIFIKKLNKWHIILAILGGPLYLFYLVGISFKSKNVKSLETTTELPEPTSDTPD